MISQSLALLYFLSRIDRELIGVVWDWGLFFLVLVKECVAYGLSTHSIWLARGCDIGGPLVLNGSDNIEHIGSCENESKLTLMMIDDQPLWW